MRYPRITPRQLVKRGALFHDASIALAVAEAIRRVDKLIFPKRRIFVTVKSPPEESYRWSLYPASLDEPEYYQIYVRGSYQRFKEECDYATLIWEPVFPTKWRVSRREEIKYSTPEEVLLGIAVYLVRSRMHYHCLIDRPFHPNTQGIKDDLLIKIIRFLTRLRRKESSIQDPQRFDGKVIEEYFLHKARYELTSFREIRKILHLQAPES